ncbi:MAG: hypothetical protein EAZ32_17365 [Cytophagia bacterium]|nr:MAG: hypothetical protein EAZ32_17365 [Cytophagia bacterium]
MQELEDAPKTLRMARLIEMIVMDNEAIATHRAHNSPPVLIAQYTELRNERSCKMWPKLMTARQTQVLKLLELNKWK